MWSSSRRLAQRKSLNRSILEAVVEQEAEAISKRTQAALAAARERGTALGGRRVSAERFAEIGAAARQAFSAQQQR